MKKTWDNLKVGDKFYSYNTYYKEWEDCCVKDIGSNGYIVYTYKDCAAKFFTDSLENIKKEYYLTKDPKSKILALIRRKEKDILSIKNCIEDSKEYTKESNRNLAEAKEELKALKQQLKDMANEVGSI